MSASFLLHANEHQQGEARQHHQLGAAVLSGADQAVAAHREDDGGHSGYPEAKIGDGEQQHSTRARLPATGGVGLRLDTGGLPGAERS